MVLANKKGGRGRLGGMLLPYAVYSIFWIMSYALEKRGLFVYAGYILMAASAVLSIYFYRKDKSLVSFRFLLSLFWTAGEGLAVMQLSNLQSEWNNLTWLSFGGFYLTFLAAYQLTENILNIRYMQNSDEKVQEHDKQDGQLERLFICIRTISLISFTTFIIEALILGYVPLFSSETHAYDHFHITGIHYFTVSCMFTHSLTLIYVLELKNRKQYEGVWRTLSSSKVLIELIIYNILSLSIPVLSVSKFQFVLTLALPVLIYLFMRPNVNKRKLAAGLGGIFVLVAAAAVFMTVRRNYEPGYLNSIFQMKDEDMPLYLQYVYMYIANNYSNFNCLTNALKQGEIAHSFGLKQLFPVFALTGTKFVFPSLVAFVMPTTITELNTLTLIYDAYYDFGLIGVVLFGIFLGMVCSVLTAKTKRSSNPILYLFYAQIALYLVLSFFSAWFTVPTTWFWFALTAMMYLYTKSGAQWKNAIRKALKK